jgi:hypothetical protein
MIYAEASDIEIAFMAFAAGVLTLGFTLGALFIFRRMRRRRAARPASLFDVIGAPGRR